MWWKHVKLAITLVFLTISIVSLLPVVILTGRVGEYAPSDVVALYNSVVEDIYTK